MVDRDGIKQLSVYLDLCGEKQVLLETVWLAFRYKDTHKGWDVNKCFEEAIWNVMLAEAKREVKTDLKATVDKINSISSMGAVKKSG
jgi:hypothetical protein